MKDFELYNGDCLELMNEIPDKSVDLILCDLPYGTTSCKWDCCIDLEKLWKQYKRILKDKGNILLFGDGSLFTASLMMSNKEWFKYNWIWDKETASGGFSARIQPLRCYETISVFYNKKGNYFPQMTKGKPHTTNGHGSSSNSIYGKKKSMDTSEIRDEYYPKNILRYKSMAHQGRLHPSQKNVELLEYLIKTYTTEGMTVLDNTMGSGSTIIAAVNTNRRAIGIEKDEKYFNTATKRIVERIAELEKLNGK